MPRPRVIATAGFLSALATAFGAAAQEEDNTPYIVPLVRPAVGPTFRIDPKGKDNVAVEATAGAAIYFNAAQVKEDSFLFAPEVGYAFDGALTTHAFNLSFGFGYGLPGISVAYQPRLLIGDELIGMRNGITAHLGLSAVTVELGHQFVSLNKVMHQDVKLLFGLNFGLIAYALGYRDSG